MIWTNRISKMAKCQKHERGRYLFLIAFILFSNGLSAKKWHKYFHLGELTEFNRATLEILRQPLEDRKITITRANYSVEYPCSFMLVASMNPCPCGYYGDPLHKCTCTPGQISRYLSKISGPLLDRIDIHCEIQAVPFSELSKMKPGEPSTSHRQRVIKARLIQEERFKDYKNVHCNAQMTERMLHMYAEPDDASLEMLRMAMAEVNRYGVTSVQSDDYSTFRSVPWQLGLHVYAQSIFLDYDNHIVRKLVPEELANTSYSWKTLLRKGVCVSNGSDCPVELPNVMSGIQCAVTRQSLDGFGPFLPREAFTVQEALDSFTSAGAHASFEEHKKGRIQEGMLADFVILDQDPFETEPGEISKIKVKAVYLNGKEI